ncbi:ATP-dependent DNA ligase [Paenibacillus agricola]|uniref:ATP-dependent DNA ligase n=1 Tax=Paenibacillus agricola TaxID=2716264 RepID=UPI001FB65148|nr:hypothetical protein [Paenibacillus agricola]
MIIHGYTRHQNNCSVQYPDLGHIGIDDVLLDGEAAATNEFGRIDFERIMERFSLKKLDKIRKGAENRSINFIAFDILRYKGKDLRSYPLSHRKGLLGSLNFQNPHIGVIPYIQTEGERLFVQMVALNMEGMVAKRANSIYVSGRSKAWLKVINWTLMWMCT